MSKLRDRSNPPTEAEKQQVRARRIVGHDFALRADERGRDRQARGTAEAARRYDIASAGGVVRVRTVDPLIGISSLSTEQRQAGHMYRDDREASTVSIRGAYLEERVDGGRVGGGLPAALLRRGQRLQSATRAIGHPDIVAVVEGVCVAGHSVKALAQLTSESRDVVVRLLRIGLDNLAVHYGLAALRRKAG